MSARETVLGRIVAETRAELARRPHEPPPQPVRQARNARGFRDALTAAGIGVIAEFKRRSPSAGALHDSPDLERIVAAYEDGGAVAVSVLTEGPNFGGALADLASARQACALPLLRKDFIVDERQLDDAAAAGADAVLLIVAALAQDELAYLHGRARELDLDVLVEVHDDAELARAIDVGAEIVGVNNRDLRDFSVDVSRTEQLLGSVPAGVLVVSESGIAEPAQLQRLGERGVAAVLVGEALMRAGDPAAELRRLRGLGRGDDGL